MTEEKQTRPRKPRPSRAKKKPPSWAQGPIEHKMFWRINQTKAGPNLVMESKTTLSVRDFCLQGVSSFAVNADHFADKYRERFGA